MTFALPASLAAHFTECPVCRGQSRELVLHGDGQVSCADADACAKDVAALAAWCDAQQEEAAARDALERNLFMG